MIIAKGLKKILLTIGPVSYKKQSITVKEGENSENIGRLYLGLVDLRTVSVRYTGW